MILHSLTSLSLDDIASPQDDCNLAPTAYGEPRRLQALTVNRKNGKENRQLMLHTDIVCDVDVESFGALMSRECPENACPPSVLVKRAVMPWGYQWS